MTDNTNKENIGDRKKVAALPTVFRSVVDLKLALNDIYLKQIENYFSDQRQAMRFMSGVIAAVQRNPKLLECTPISVINSFMTMAQLQLMPSDVSGEAYVIPYNNNKKVSTNPDKWEKVMEAQFQLGYQGLVTLLYRSGTKEIITELVYEKDKFSYINGSVKHKPDVFSDNRGKVKGAYAIIKLGTGGVISKVMSIKEIMDIAQKFSKSYKTDQSPWESANDPQGWMLKKTVLKQSSKLVPKNEFIVKAIEEDNKDSIIADRLEAAEEESRSLKMGNLLKPHEENAQNGENKDEFDSAESAKIDAESIAGKGKK